ncbi:MAG: hypothetical protein J1F68_00615 [Clostridiales bacterium]|nr:hypothetical protein [Clostridiales bacterium]
METLIFGFMVLVVVMCIFTVCVVVRDMLRDSNKRKTKKSADTTQVGQQQAAQQSTVVIAADDDQVRFSAEPKQSHKYKYMALSGEQKAWYDEIAEYANRVEEVKCVTTGGYDEYRLHGKRIIRLLIKRGTVICEFIIANPNFSRYVSTNKISVKQAATSLKLLTAKDVGAAKDSIDIAVREIREEREEAKRREKERRRLARQASHAAATQVQTVATTSAD